jgi:hypothetical protein
MAYSSFPRKIHGKHFRLKTSAILFASLAANANGTVA